jgi:hypothetical protein
MYAFDAHERLVWNALKAKGLLKEAKVALPGCPTESVTYVDLTREDAEFSGSLSTEWMIDYVDGELPGLAEGTEVVIDATLFKVRKTPETPPLGSGFWKRALLTRVGEC